MKRIMAHWSEDAAFHYSPRTAPRSVLRRIANPSLAAALLFRIAASERPLTRFLARWLLLTTFSCDVSPGARFAGPIDLPHPVGIVIGKGASFGSRVRLFQNVTVGSSRRGEYPNLGNDVTVYSNAVIAGRVTISDHAVIGANATVTRDVSAQVVVRAAQTR